MAKKAVKVPKRLGKNIQKKRKELGFTQEDLAFKVGISRAYMGYVEQGRNAPSLEVLQKVAKELKIKLNSLF